MAEHLTLVSLRRALSAQGRVSEKVADDFLSALLGCISEGLQKDGQVAINGLGTFKLQDVPARESINVTTGERFTINGYKKVVFTAGATRTNSGTKKTEEPIDPIQKLGEQAEEIKDILSELNAMSAEGATLPSTDSTETMEATKTTEATETKETTETTETTEKAPVPQQPKKPFNPWLTGLITIGVFAMLLVIAYFILRHQIVNWADGMRSNIEQRVNTVPDEQPAPVLEIPETTETTEPTKVLPDYYDDSKRVFTEFQATETVGKDSRLAWVAKKHYGEKALWVFVYEANRNKLNDPDIVLPGTKLRIPKLPADLRDVNNPDTKALLDRLSDKYLGN